MKDGINKMLRALFEKPYLYSMENLNHLTGHTYQYIATEVSNLQNPNRCGPPGPVMLKRIKFPDGVVRIGNLDAKDIYETKN
jgi:hypothetical protein